MSALLPAAVRPLCNRLYRSGLVSFRSGRPIVVARPMGNDSSMEVAPSRTAIMAAVARGRHPLEDPPPLILDDPIALQFVGPSWRDIAASSDSRYSVELGRQIRAAITIRSRYAEDRLELGHFRQY